MHLQLHLLSFSSLFYAASGRRKGAGRTVSFGSSDTGGLGDMFRAGSGTGLLRTQSAATSEQPQAEQAAPTGDLH